MVKEAQREGVKRKQQRGKNHNHGNLGPDIFIWARAIGISSMVPAPERISPGGWGEWQRIPGMVEGWWAAVIQLTDRGPPVHNVRDEISKDAWNG
jgi:hypothetical protein